jgi:hypothetical protein
MVTYLLLKERVCQGFRFNALIKPPLHPEFVPTPFPTVTATLTLHLRRRVSAPSLLAASSSKDCELYFKTMLLCAGLKFIASVSQHVGSKESHGQLMGKKKATTESKRTLCSENPEPWCRGLTLCTLN